MFPEFTLHQIWIWFIGFNTYFCKILDIFDREIGKGNLSNFRHWSVGIDKWFHYTIYWACDYLSMLGLKFIHVSKRGYWFLYLSKVLLQYLSEPMITWHANLSHCFHKHFRSHLWTALQKRQWHFNTKFKNICEHKLVTCTTSRK